MNLTLSRALAFVSLLACSACGGELRMPIEAPRAGQDAYAERLVALAHARDLAHASEWLRLGHYRTGLLGRGFLGGGYKSEADGPGFFLSPRGKHDPQAELDATIRALLAPVDPGAKLGKNETIADAHAVCRFPARLIYLSRALGLDASRLRATGCPALAKFFTDLDPKSVTLMFSSYYLNSPASAFGHTFLRINKAGTLVVGKRRELLDYGVDFSADVDSENAVIYAVKGLTGMFPGTFKQIPYYYKVRQYNDIESRDLWEYELALRPEQLAMLIAHLWELGHTYFDYYYLSENCSYHILALIEAAVPEIELTARLSSPVLPTDTVKVLVGVPGLVREVRYRPSLRTQFRARAESMSDDELDLVDELVYDADTALPARLPDTRKIAVLDAAADLVDVRYGEALVMKTDSDAAKKKQRLLERRAAILLPSSAVDVPPPRDKAPEAGHASHRVGIGGALAHGMAAPTLDFRINLHDLADPPAGYPELNAIEFFHARLQIWPDGKIETDDIAVFRVTSLTLQSRFDRKLSWKFDVGATTLDDRACTRCNAAHMGGGVGMAFAPFGDAATLFITTDADIFLAPRLDGIDGSGFRIGAGPAGGLRLRFLPTLVFLATGQYIFLPWQAPKGVHRVDGVLRFEYTRDFALSLEARAQPNGYEGQLVQLVYF